MDVPEYTSSGESTSLLPKLKLLLTLVLFLVQVGLLAIGAQPSLEWGILCWLAIMGLSIHMFWVWERSRKLRLGVRLVASALFAGVVIALVWSPLNRQYQAQHPPQQLAHPVSSTPPSVTVGTMITTGKDSPNMAGSGNTVTYRTRPSEKDDPKQPKEKP